jgi:hypothetical protein
LLCIYRIVNTVCFISERHEPFGVRGDLIWLSLLGFCFNIVERYLTIIWGDREPTYAGADGRSFYHLLLGSSAELQNHAEGSLKAEYILLGGQTRYQAGKKMSQIMILECTSAC